MGYYTYDKKKNLVTLSSAILKHFTGSSFHEPNEEIYALLSSKNYQKVIVCLFDGMGKSIQDKHLSKGDFIYRNNKYLFTSIFPPTTVACTNAFLSGKFPKETGWLGWSQYFYQHDVTIDMFTNEESFTKEKIHGPKLADKYCAYTSIIDLINESKKAKATSIFPYPIDDMGPKGMEDFFSYCDVMMKKDYNFIYAYNTQPDASIHQYGVNHPIVKKNVQDINYNMRKLAKAHPDWLILVIADHSLIDVEFHNVKEYEDFYQTLEHNYSVDSRTCTFFVKEGKKEEFVKAYEDHYKDDFKLFTKEEVINLNLFGEGEEHPLFKDFLGDFLLTSTGKKGFTTFEDYPMIGAHSGSTQEEYEIYVSIINK